MRQALRWLAWVGATLASLAVLSQPVGTQAQLAMSLAAMAAMIVLWSVFDGPRTRFVFMALGSLVVLRYILWRLTSTLPSPGDPISFGFGLILLVAELYCVFILFVSLIINADPLQRDPPAKAAAADLPTVDVFVPSYNEDAAILAMTLAAARQLNYPPDKLTVWLLDDGGTDQKCSDADPAKAAAARARRGELQALCDELGVRYLTRARNEHAKAGNLNNGLAHAKGELVAVLDADHVPFRSFLAETVGYFAQDPRLFLVQTPHAFLNPDPIERNLRTFERMPAENEMFYAVTQRGLDKWNGSFFCGSAALLRRIALDEAGGFSGITITEDCETAFELHSRNWTSAYVDRPLIAGLQPDTLTDFIGQRSRWCQGMFQILMLKNPIFQKGLKPVQKIAYLSSMTFWFFPIPRLIFMFAPLLHIFFDLKIFVASVDESIAYTLTYIIINLMIQNYIYGKFRWPFVSELYEYIQGVYLAKAIVSVIASPRKPTFNVTNKGATLDHDHISSLALPFFLIHLLLMLGCAVAAWRYLFEPGVTNLMLVVGLWNFFNLLTAGASLGVCAERRQLERTPSLAIDRRGVLSLSGRSTDVAIELVSAEACTVRLLSGAFDQGLVRTSLRGALSVEPTAGARRPAPLPVHLEKATRDGRELVLRLSFGELAVRDYPALAGLMYGDAEAMRRFQLRRRRHKDIPTGTLQFAWWGLVEPFRALRYLLASRRPRPVEVGEALVYDAPSGAASLPAVPSVPVPEAGSHAAPVPAAAKTADAESGDDWVRLMMDYENERTLAELRGRRSSAA
ncbi:UDP-forming cellulose synthase catalytic subunit [Methylobacterium sp. WL64]|uniref:UDP-forming cellulose synthase catalytic subunit n=1 Tax=unclassified Methylobacterium TaxID=2615210 RepID=UPI0011C74F3E|nr:MULTISPECIES: UDP-forming cellulose synthase catalytic subunit [unclassified Methylobacterium]MCJ2119383.1 UDP-forming cellulose synthase catalytic subunit [Methylobacterium sp. J-001]TXM97833.1 UDP-forming cellulose synthase catalytic subunit [Methylobacterium sp. WL64]